MRVAVVVWLFVLLFMPAMVQAEERLDHVQACLVANELPLTRPGDASGVPTKVNINAYIINIEEINDINGTFTIDFVLVQSWHDQRLIHGIQSDKQECAYPLDQVWHPNLNIFNTRGVETLLPKQVVVKSGGHVRYLQRFYGELAANLNLHEFPFDEQNLPLQLVAFGHTAEHISLNFLPSLSGHGQYTATNWHIYPGIPSVGTFVAESDQGNLIVELVKFEYAFKAQRWLSYYIWKIFTPMMLIVFMSWAVFWVSPLKMEVQVGLAATTILTLIAFLFSVSALLPKVSYLTVMDMFVFICLVFVFLAFIEAIATCSLGIKQRVELAEKIDRLSRFVFPSCFAVAMTVLWMLFC